MEQGSKTTRPADPAESGSLAEEIGKRTPFSSAAQEACLNVWRTSQALQHEFDALFKRHGISNPQYNVLRIARGHAPQGVTTSTISQQLISRGPDVTRLVNGLEKAGFVERKRCKSDRRCVYIHVTDGGLSLLDRLAPDVADLHERQMRLIPADQLVTASALLTRMREGAALPTQDNDNA